MKRAAVERPRTVREWHRHVTVIHDGEPGPCACDQQPGRFRKTDAFDCGKTQCLICHSAKVRGQKTHRQHKADVSFREQLKEQTIS